MMNNLMVREDVIVFVADFYVSLSNGDDKKKTQVIMVGVHLDERDYLLDAMAAVYHDLPYRKLHATCHCDRLNRLICEASCFFLAPLCWLAPALPGASIRQTVPLVCTK